MSKQDPRPLYFVDDYDKIKVDIDHSEWTDIIQNRKSSVIKNGVSSINSLNKTTKKKATKQPTNKKSSSRQKEPLKTSAKVVPKEKTKSPQIKKIEIDIPEPTQEEKEYDVIYEQARIAKLEQEILKAQLLEYKNEQEKLKLMKESGGLIEYALADYLFVGFMELTNSQILQLMKKIEPVVVNMCKENDPKAILKRLTRDLEAIIRDVKDNQAAAVKTWKKEDL